MSENPYDAYHLTVEGLVDYCTCPLIYLFRYVHKLEWNMPPAQAYQTALRGAAHYLFRAVQGGYYPALPEMKRVWGVVWHQKAKRLGISQDYINRQNVLGLEQLVKMQQFFRGNPGNPILVNREYTITTNGIRLTGQVDLIREWHGKLEVFAFNPTPRPPSKIFTVFDPTLIAAGMGMEQLLSQSIDRAYVYFIRQARVSEYKINAKDIENFGLMVQRIRAAISAGTFYPRLFDDYCVECSFWAACKNKDWYIDSVPNLNKKVPG